MQGQRSSTDAAGRTRCVGATGLTVALAALSGAAAICAAPIGPIIPQTPPLTALQRLNPPYLASIRAEVAAHASARVPVSLATGFEDVRCVIHAHSDLSHDSRGTVKEIAAAARSAGVRAVFITNHTRADVDVIEKGPSGIIDDVLFVPGAETRGYLLFPKDRRVPDGALNGQALVNQVVDAQGLAFVCHPEEHKDWTIGRLTGMEVYNTHANFMEQRELLAALQPRSAAGYGKLLEILKAMKEYPQEAFGCFFGPPVENLTHYDAKAGAGPFTAVAANDSHQNVGYVFRGDAGGRIVVEDALGEKVGEIDTARFPIARTLLGEPVPGRELFRTIVDPYPVSFHYVSTHVLARSVSEADLWAELRAGRTYVAFDWLADPSGAAFIARSGRRRWTLGDTISSGGAVRFTVELPLAGSIRALRNGAEVATARGRSLEFSSDVPGVYRFEAALPLAGEMRPWIYTGAIRVTRPEPSRNRSSHTPTAKDNNNG